MDIRRAAVIGAGVMGSGIAQTLAVAGCTVMCRDIDDTQLDAARTLVEDGRYGVRRAAERGKLAPEEADAALERLRFTIDLDEAVDGADLVIEAVPEDLGLKMRLFQQLDAIAPAKTILATNSSGLPVIAMATATGRPERVLGWHWSSPAPVMRMAEIVVTAHTGDDVREAVVALASRCGKNPVVVKDHPTAWGYVGNRIYAAAIREARAIVAEGIADPAGVDRILQDGWGWPAGPFAMVRGATEGWGDGRTSSVGTLNRPPGGSQTPTRANPSAS